MAGKLGGITCCCDACVSFSDNFTRADSTNLGSDWNEVSGDWSISGNRCQVTAVAGTVELRNTIAGASPADSGQYAKATINSSDAAAVIEFGTGSLYGANPGGVQVILDFALDTVTCFSASASFTFNASTDYIIEIQTSGSKEGGNGTTKVIIDGTCILTTDGFAGSSPTHSWAIYCALLTGTLIVDSVESSCPPGLRPCIWPNVQAMPSQVKVTLAVTNALCSDCDSLDGDYWLQATEEVDFPNCLSTNFECVYGYVLTFASFCSLGSSGLGGFGLGATLGFAFLNDGVTLKFCGNMFTINFWSENWQISATNFCTPGNLTRNGVVDRLGNCSFDITVVHP